MRRPCYRGVFHEQHTKESQELSALKETHSHHTQQFTSRLGAFDTTVDELKQKYLQSFQLNAPLTYWLDRHKKHARWTIWWSVILMAAFAAGGVLFWRLFEQTPTPEASIAALKASLPSGTLTGDQLSMELARTWLMYMTWKALALLFVVWVIRLIVRNYLSDQHLANDASERAVVLQTFLSMNSHSDFENKELRAQALGDALKVIFRHTQDGVVRDDAMPSAVPVWWMPKS